MDQEQLARLAATPKALAHLVAEATDAQLDAEAMAEWSARTILAHFRDEEALVFRTVLGRLLTEDAPDVTFLPADRWAEGRFRGRDRKEHLLADFALQRQATLGMLGCLTSEDLARSGRIVARDRTISVDDLVALWVRHDANHVEQLERALGETLEEVRERRARMVDG